MYTATDENSAEVSGKIVQPFRRFHSIHSYRACGSFPIGDFLSYPLFFLPGNAMTPTFYSLVFESSTPSSQKNGQFCHRRYIIVGGRGLDTYRNIILDAKCFAAELRSRVAFELSNSLHAILRRLKSTINKKALVAGNYLY